MKYLASLVILALLILSACAFHPVMSQVDFAAMQTATAAVPPLPTMEPQVVPPTATEETLVPTVTPECLIKVNRSSDGTLVYHLPGQPTYGQTKIDTSKGEFFACDEQQAIDAGARKAQR